MRRDTLGEKLWATLVWVVVGFFVLNLVAMIATVVVNSFATRWLGTWLPVG
ncbi:MAG: ABC transporter permease, partial [Nevskiales bacterium]